MSLSRIQHTESPIEEIKYPGLDDFNVKIYLKRDDLLPGILSGNKARKLYFNIHHYFESGFKSIVTIGGAYSNHLLAMSKVCREMGIPLTVLVRGEEPEKLSEVLEMCLINGAKIVWIDRASFRKRYLHEQIFHWLKSESLVHPALWVPEGGNNEFGALGCQRIIEEINRPFDYFCLPCGTGSTMAGCLRLLNNRAYCIGISVLKMGYGMRMNVAQLSDRLQSQNRHWHIEKGFHFGGYAKVTEGLTEFRKNVHDISNGSWLPDLTYNSKAFFGVIESVKSGVIAPGSTIVYLVTQSSSN